MGFLDKARATATDLAGKADHAINQATSGGGDRDQQRHLHDLGVLAYLEAQGRPVDEEARSRALSGLRELESQGRLGSLALSSSPPPAPGAGSPPPPPGGHPAPPPP
ncbi:MAG: hypothetical protein H0U62_14635, partial [Actinobacteria bacterium]|nr:hypothetical protein [Actinomycetota bacterium]